MVSGALAVVALVSAYRDRADPERLPLVQLIWAAVGLLFVLYLVFDEIVRLHNICEWCTAVHVHQFVTFILAWYPFAAQGRRGTRSQESIAGPSIRRGGRGPVAPTDTHCRAQPAPGQ